MTKSKMLTLRLRRSFASYLALRESADRLFDQVDRYKTKDIVVDFSGVESMTRSFAHQYILRKQKSRKNVSEENMTESIASIMEMSTRPVSVASIARHSIKPMKLFL